MSCDFQYTQVGTGVVLASSRDMMDVDNSDNSDQTRLIDSAFTRPPIFDNIFSRTSPASFIRFGRTCRVARDAVSNFSSRAFSINRHLLRFFSNPIDFRSLQARTGTLISGSNALQFFDRTFYPESDLDIYTHPGHSREVGLWLMRREGYKFAPSPSQNGADFKTLVKDDWDGLARRYDPGDADDADGQQYRISGISAVYTFVKSQSDGDDTAGTPLKVQIIEAETNPLQCVFGFHSLCVMNVISFNAAYSLYPRATFEERRTLSMSVSNEGEAEALGKYAVRGWKILSDMLAHENNKPLASFHRGISRWVDDKMSWKIPLDVTGVVMRPPPSENSDAFVWDPVVHNSWKLIRGKGGRLLMNYHVAKSTLFRYNYLIADSRFLYTLLGFFRQQGSLEQLKRTFLSVEEQRASVTWWDSELEGFRKTYFEELSEERRKARELELAKRKRMRRN